jgi:hypothetical protein
MKNKLLTLFAAIGVIITLLPFSLEAGILGQWCSNEAWFGQPGGGVQHYTKGLSNVAYLKFQEYLKEIKP